MTDPQMLEALLLKNPSAFLDQVWNEESAAIGLELLATHCDRPAVKAEWQEAVRLAEDFRDHCAEEAVTVFEVSFRHGLHPLALSLLTDVPDPAASGEACARLALEGRLVWRRGAELRALALAYATSPAVVEALISDSIPSDLLFDFVRMTNSPRAVQTLLHRDPSGDLFGDSIERITDIAVGSASEDLARIALTRLARPPETPRPGWWWAFHGEVRRRLRLAERLHQFAPDAVGSWLEQLFADLPGGAKAGGFSFDEDRVWTLWNVVGLGLEEAAGDLSAPNFLRVLAETALRARPEHWRAWLAIEHLLLMTLRDERRATLSGTAFEIVRDQPAESDGPRITRLWPMLFGHAAPNDDLLIEWAFEDLRMRGKRGSRLAALSEIGSKELLRSIARRFIQSGARWREVAQEWAEAPMSDVALASVRPAFEDEILALVDAVAEAATVQRLLELVSAIATGHTARLLREKAKCADGRRGELLRSAAADIDRAIKDGELNRANLGVRWRSVLRGLA